MKKVPKLPELEVGVLSVTGPVREDNQDAVFYPNGSTPALAGSLHAVADGMGGYSCGGVASDLALKALTSRLADSVSAPPARALRSGIESANLDVYKAAQNMGAGRMGTTLTAAYILGDMLYLAHVGDSRLYLVRDGRATCLTSDHTVVGDMVRSRLISPARLRTHAQRSVLTRAVGLALFIQPDLDRVTLQPGDTIILCSDGVWSMVEDEEFARAAAGSGGARALSQQLVDLALERRTDDNCSVIAVQVHGFRSEPAGEETRPERSWLGWARK